MAKRSEEMLRSGSFGTLIVRLCLPTVVVMIVMILYNMADIFFIGQTGDPYMIAAVSLCGPLFSLLSGLGTLFGSGGCTAISLALGSGDRDQVRRYTSLCFYCSILTGVLFTLIVITNLDWVCRFIGSDDLTLGYTKDYLRIIALGAPITMFSQGFGSLVRADGSVAVTMKANITGNIVNIILDPLMILTLGMGVRGAAIATVIGNCAGSLILFHHIRKNCRDTFSFRFQDFSLSKEVALPVFSLGIPMCFSTVLMSLTHVVSNNRMMRYGAVALAARSVAGRLGMLITMIVMGICMGMQPAISYNYAAGAKERLRYIVKNTGILAVSAGTILSLFCLVFRGVILSSFTSNEEVLSMATTMVIASVMIGPVYGLYQLCTTYLQAIGEARYATIASLLNKAIIFLPVLFIMDAAFGMYGLVFSNFVTDFLSVFVSYALVRLAAKNKAKASPASGANAA